MAPGLRISLQFLVLMATRQFPSLGAPTKWHQERQDLQVGEVVQVLSLETARGNLPLGRVVEVYPGNDGRVRVAKLQVEEGALVRPVMKLCPLECDP